MECVVLPFGGLEPALLVPGSSGVRSRRCGDINGDKQIPPRASPSFGMTWFFSDRDFGQAVVAIEHQLQVSLVAGAASWLRHGNKLPRSHA